MTDKEICVSWDVGIKNLAFCILTRDPHHSPHEASITEWKNISIIDTPPCTECGKPATKKTQRCSRHGKGLASLPKPSTAELKECLIKKLDSMGDQILECNAVVIENQPTMKNPIMKAIADCLYDYYLIRGIIDKKITQKIFFVSPQNKTKILLPAKKRTYRETKDDVLQFCRDTLLEHCPELQLFLATHKKKDDLCDALAQGIAFLHKVKNGPITLLPAQAQAQAQTQTLV